MENDTKFMGLYVTDNCTPIATSDSKEMIHAYLNQFKPTLDEYEISTEIRLMDNVETETYQDHMLMWFDDNIVLTEKEYSLVLDWLNNEWYSYIHMVGMMKRYQETMNFDRDTVATLEKTIFDIYDVIKSYKMFINNIRPEAILKYLDWTALELNPTLKEIYEMKQAYKHRTNEE